MCNAWNHGGYCTCGFGGDTGGGGYHYIPQMTIVQSRPSRPWRLESLGQRLTRPIRCWWCPELVFFHTNGNGDCVLLDSLGWPWPVHSCWEKYRWEQAQKVRSFEDTLYAQGFDGRFLATEGRMAHPPDERGGRLVCVNGFVSDNHGFYESPETTRLSLGVSKDGLRWVRLDVSDGEVIYPFLVPLSKAGKFDDYCIVRAVGRWVEREGAWHLILGRLTICDQNSRPRTVRIAWLGREFACRYCGRRIRPEEPWGFDRGARVECGGCFDLRDGRSPREFLAFCRRIARNNRPARKCD